MNVYFSPLSVADPKGQELAEKLTRHLQTREVAIINRSSPDPDRLRDASGLIVELSYQQEEELRLIEAAGKLGKPILALAWRYSKVEPIIGKLDEEKVRKVLYSELFVATVAIDVFLEAHCGYRVPLGPGDRMNLPEEKDKY